MFSFTYEHVRITALITNALATGLNIHIGNYGWASIHALIYFAVLKH